MSASLWPHGPWHTRLPCPPLSPRDCSNSCPLSRWYHPTISSSVVPFSSHLQSFPASGSFPVSQFFTSRGQSIRVSASPCLQSFPKSGSFPMSQLFTSGDQSIGASASAWVLPMNIQIWFLLGLTDLIPLAVQGTLKSSPAQQFESINSSALSLLYGPTLISVHDYWKKHSFDYVETTSPG